MIIFFINFICGKKVFIITFFIIAVVFDVSLFPFIRLTSDYSAKNFLARYLQVDYIGEVCK